VGADEVGRAKAREAKDSALKEVVKNARSAVEVFKVA
jgi:hypothetical protein